MSRDKPRQVRDGEGTERKRGNDLPSRVFSVYRSFLRGKDPGQVALWVTITSVFRSSTVSVRPPLAAASSFDLSKSEHVVDRKTVLEVVMVYHELSEKILDAVFVVHRTLGQGLLENCYHNALFYELKSAGLHVEYNAPFTVEYKGNVVGEYYADLLVNGKVILELKSVRTLGNEHVAQLLNYLHISGCRLGYLLNFQNSRMEFKRLMLDKKN